MKRLILASIVAACMASQGSALVLLTEDFTYSDGALTAVSGGNWTSHSGTALQQDVSSGALNLTQAESEDANRTFAAQVSGEIFTGVDINFSALPSGTGAYFLHYKDATTGFRGRVFATTTGAAAGTYRVGITEGATGTPNTVAADLLVGTTYRLVFSTDVATNDSTVEIVGLGSAVSPADATAPAILSAVATRQSLGSGNGMGTLRLDNMIVATSRIEAVPEPATMLALVGGVAALIRRRKRS